MRYQTYLKCMNVHCKFNQPMYICSFKDITLDPYGICKKQGTVEIDPNKSCACCKYYRLEDGKYPCTECGDTDYWGSC